MHHNMRERKIFSLTSSNPIPNPGPAQLNVSPSNLRVRLKITPPPSPSPVTPIEQTVINGIEEEEMEEGREREREGYREKDETGGIGNENVALSRINSAGSSCNLHLLHLLSHLNELTYTDNTNHSSTLPSTVLCKSCHRPIGSHIMTDTIPPTSADSCDLLLTSKLINDPIHGHILLSSDLIRLIDTPHFQRLRDLKQLGTLYYVFPGASHNRFEHSIGVCHLAGVMAEHLRRSQPELGMTEREILLIKMAGLCVRKQFFSHHLEFGHGPFSHVFDNEFMPRARPDRKWRHEEASIMMTEAALQHAGLELESIDLQFLRELINPKDFPKHSIPKPYLYEIVANARTSLDVDKMITDVLLLANPVLHIADSIDNPDSYLKMTDCIIKQIESSTDPLLEPARTLLLRVRTRQLYRMVEEAMIPHSHMYDPDILSRDILACADSHQLAQHPMNSDDIIVQNLRINYSMDNKNPVDTLKFYDKSNLNHSYLIPKEKVSAALPHYFQERSMRVYIKDSEDDISGEKSKWNMIRYATKRYIDKNNCISPVITRTASNSALLKTSILTANHSPSVRRTTSSTSTATATSVLSTPPRTPLIDKFSSPVIKDRKEGKGRILEEFTRIEEGKEGESEEKKEGSRKNDIRMTGKRGFYSDINHSEQIEEEKYQQEEDNTLLPDGGGRKEKKRKKR